jgi:hypothetical protein
MPFAGLQHAAAITTSAQTRLQHNGLYEYLLIRSQPGGLHPAERECVAAGMGKPRPRCAAQGGVAGFHLCYKRDALVWILWLAGTCGWLCDTRSHRCQHIRLPGELVAARACLYALHRALGRMGLLTLEEIQSFPACHGNEFALQVNLDC